MTVFLIGSFFDGIDLEAEIPLMSDSGNKSGDYSDGDVWRELTRVGTAFLFNAMETTSTLDCLKIRDSAGVEFTFCRTPNENKTNFWLGYVRYLA